MSYGGRSFLRLGAACVAKHWHSEWPCQPLWGLHQAAAVSRHQSTFFIYTFTAAAIMMMQPDRLLASCEFHCPSQRVTC